MRLERSRASRRWRAAALGRLDGHGGTLWCVTHTLTLEDYAALLVKYRPATPQDTCAHMPRPPRPYSPRRAASVGHARRGPALGGGGCRNF
eukprot:3026612-Prymnesium_polylepis.1